MMLLISWDMRHGSKVVNSQKKATGSFELPIYSNIAASAESLSSGMLGRKGKPGF